MLVWSKNYYSYKCINDDHRGLIKYDCLYNEYFELSDDVITSIGNDQYGKSIMWTNHWSFRWEGSLKNGREPIYEMQNGASLSRRQRQLLSIACAAVANLPVMILDEATSSIDIRTEVLVQQGMDNLMRGRTTYVIAHWLSTVCNSETIIVLNFGKIIEWGSHDELISKHDVYYSFYTDAFELE